MVKLNGTAATPLQGWRRDDMTAHDAQGHRRATPFGVGFAGAVSFSCPLKNIFAARAARLPSCYGRVRVHWPPSLWAAVARASVLFPAAAWLGVTSDHRTGLRVPLPARLFALELLPHLRYRPGPDRPGRRLRNRRHRPALRRTPGSRYLACGLLPWDSAQILQPGPRRPALRACPARTAAPAASWPGSSGNIAGGGAAAAARHPVGTVQIGPL